MSKIQILGLRDYVRKDGKLSKAERFFELGWRLDSIHDIFTEKLPEQLAKIPENERFNIYYTVANCLEAKGRRLLEQYAIPFDIDHVVPTDDTTLNTVVEIFSNTIRSFYNSEFSGSGIGAVFSGHGVQILYFLDYPIADDTYFDKYRVSYKDFCNLFQEALGKAGVSGQVDSSVFSPGRLMRLPDTINRKKDLPDIQSRILQYTPGANKSFLVPKEEDSSQYVARAALSVMQIDTSGVQAECDFLAHCKDKPGEIKEPAWYAMIGVVSWLENGEKLCHDYSSGHPGYSEHETQMKIHQAQRMTGPRTCQSIDSLWGKCSGCKHFGNIKTPLQIMSDNFIKTETTGFRRLVLGKDGNLRPGPIEYGDVLKAFVRDYKYKAQALSADARIPRFWTYIDNLWQPFPRLLVEDWLEKVCKGDIRASEVSEAIAKLGRNNVCETDFFERSHTLYKQFENCVLSIETGEMLAHSPEYGINTSIPHHYDKTKTCPRWDQFLDEICEGDEGKIRLLNEFAGYILFSPDNWLQKTLILIGNGANGKSVYLEIMAKLVGKNNYSAVPIHKLDHEYNVAALENKLLNVSGETSFRALRDSSNFKDMVAGGEVIGRNPYESPRPIKIRAKFILACNEPPETNDSTEGFGRRPIIIELNRMFTPDTPGYDPLLSRKLEAELPGIINRVQACYQDLKARGRFDETEEILASKAAFIRGGNYVDEFVHQTLEAGSSEDFVKSGDLIDLAKEFCFAQNIDDKRIHSRVIARVIRTKFGIRTTVLRKVAGKVVRVWEGIKIKDYTEVGNGF